MIKTIIFDLGKVIVPFDFARGYTLMEQTSGLTPVEIRQRLAQDDLFVRFESGALTPEAFVQEVNSRLGSRSTLPEFAEIWFSIFSKETLLSEEFLIKLHARYRLLLLSNTNALHFELLAARYPLLRHFDHFVLSYEVGAMKPSPVIFQEALKHAQAAPAECFYTDDIAEYVTAARSLGIDAVQFHSAAQIEQELRARGVTW